MRRVRIWAIQGQFTPERVASFYPTEYYTHGADLTRKFKFPSSIGFVRTWLGDLIQVFHCGRVKSNSVAQARRRYATWDAGLASNLACLGRQDIELLGSSQILGRVSLRSKTTKYLKGLPKTFLQKSPE